MLELKREVVKLVFRILFFLFNSNNFHLLDPLIICFWDPKINLTTPKWELRWVLKCPLCKSCPHYHILLNQVSIAAITSLFMVIIMLALSAPAANGFSLRGALLGLGSKQHPVEVAPPIRGKDIVIGDGDVVGNGGMFVYNCKICSMPRLFKMNMGSFIFLPWPWYGHKYDYDIHIIWQHESE